MRYRALFENSGTAIVIIEEDMTISLSNAEFSRLTGYLQSEIDGKMRWTDFVLKEDLDTMVAQHRLRRLHRDEALKRYEFRLRSKTGDIHNILLCIDMIQDSEQSVASLMDITKQKQVQSELRRLSDELSSLYRYLARIHTPAFQRNADNWLLSL
jgi:PAS domain S-box-containing protein